MAYTRKTLLSLLAKKIKEENNVLSKNKTATEIKLLEDGYVYLYNQSAFEDFQSNYESEEEITNIIGLDDSIALISSILLNRKIFDEVKLFELRSEDFFYDFNKEMPYVNFIKNFLLSTGGHDPQPRHGFKNFEHHKKQIDFWNKSKGVNLNEEFTREQLLKILDYRELA